MDKAPREIIAGKLRLREWPAGAAYGLADDAVCDLEDAGYRIVPADALEKLCDATRGLLVAHIAHHNSIGHAAARAALEELTGDTPTTTSEDHHED